MTRTGRFLLACWLVVATTGSVVHHHGPAAPGHTHGLGWLSLPTAPETPAGDLPADHRHVVLLGVEFGAIPDADGDGSVVGPVVGDCAPDSGAVAAPASPVGPPPVAVFTPGDGQVVPTPVRPTARAGPAFAPTRSGVLRT